MKHLFFLVGLLCLTAAPISSFAQAQNAKDLRKERLEMLKASKSELNEKASKAAKKEAKKLRKKAGRQHLVHSHWKSSWISHTLCSISMTNLCTQCTSWVKP